MDHDPSPTPPPPHGNGRNGSGYRAARIGTAAALTALLFLLFVLDFASPDYTLSEITIVVMLTTILALLGVEAADTLGQFLGKRR